MSGVYMPVIFIDSWKQLYPIFKIYMAMLKRILILFYHCRYALIWLKVFDDIREPHISACLTVFTRCPLARFRKVYICGKQKYHKVATIWRVGATDKKKIFFLSNRI